VGLDVGLLRVVDGPGGPVTNGYGRLLGRHEAVVLERSPADQLLLLVRSIEVLDGELDIEGRPGRPFLSQPLVEGLAFLLLLRRGAERLTGERAVRLLDHRLQL